MQRWINRDPLGERLDPNIYGFVRNNPIEWIDWFGLYVVGTPIAINPNEDTIECRGGILRMHLGRTQKGNSDRACTAAHEAVHLQDFTDRYGPNLCKGVPDGQLPQGGPGFADFQRQTECNAYQAGLQCRLNQNCDGSPIDALRRQIGIQRDENEIAKLGCNKTSSSQSPPVYTIPAL